MNNLFVAKYDDEIPENALDINTTSRSLNWTKGLSPFYLGPIKLYENYVSKNIENAWQFSKVYNEFIDENNNIKNKLHTKERIQNMSKPRSEKGKNNIKNAMSKYIKKIYQYDLNWKLLKIWNSSGIKEKNLKPSRYEWN